MKLSGTTLRISLAGLVLLAVYSCAIDADSIGKINTLEINGGMEDASASDPNIAEGWALRFYNQQGKDNFKYERTDRFSSNGQYSSMLKVDAIASPDEFWYLAQELKDTELLPGSAVELSVKVKTVNLQGNGFEIALQGHHRFNQDLGFYRSSYDVTQEVSGDNDWTEYKINIYSFPENINGMDIYLIMSPNTTGELYFDEVSLKFTPPFLR